MAGGWETQFGLKARIAAAIAATCVASIAAVAIYLGWALERTAIEQWKRERVLDATTLAVGFERTIGEAIGDLRLVVSVPGMAGLPEIDRVDRSVNGLPLGLDMEKRRILDAVLEDGAFSVLFILQPNGDHYLSHPYSVQERLTRFNLAERPYFREVVRTHKPVVSDAFLGADGEPAVAIDIPRLNDKGEIVLHLGGVIHLPHLANLFNTNINTTYDVGLLADRHGNSIASAGFGGTAKLMQEPLEGALRQVQSEGAPPGLATTRSYREPNGGQEVIATFVTLHSGWTVALARGRSTFNEEVRPELIRITAMVSGLLFLVGLIGFAIATNMARHWEETQKALAAAHRELEDRIRERTADLDRSHQDLEDKSRTLESILDNVSHGISLFDADLKLVTYNRQFPALLDMPGEIIHPGMGLAELLRFVAARGDYGPCDVEEFVERRIELARSFVPHRFQRHGHDGKILDVVGTPLPGGGFVTTHTDITETTRTAEALQTLSQAIEQSPVSVVITDPHGNIEYVNPKFSAVTGYSLDEVKGQNPRILKSGQVSPDTYGDLWATIHAGRTWEGNLQNRKKNGELFWERATISPIRSPDGMVVHYLAVKEDITARRQAEAEIHAAWRAAEEANRAKTVFLSHMSHELRTPLTAVLGYAEMMAIELGGPLSPLYADYVDNIISGGRHLLSIIDEVLDISRIELGSYRISPNAVDLTGIAGECVAMMRPQCSVKGITVSLVSEGPVDITSDSRAVRQIFINLLGNAIKYTPAGGRIVVSTKYTPDRDGCFEIADTGCGIAQDKLDTIFEPFQRADPLRADPARGVGLGLAICRRIIELLEGNICIRSKPDQGTTVTVFLPAGAAIAVAS